MRTIVHRKDSLWAGLATIGFLLSLAAFAVWLDHRSHVEVSVFTWFTWFFSGLLVLLCFIPITAIRKPQSWLLAIDGGDLLWRISNRKTRQIGLERRLPLDSIRALKWVIPRPPDCRRGQDYSSARLFFITAERSSHTLPDGFFPANYRRKIEAALKEELPTLKIVERLESP